MKISPVAGVPIVPNTQSTGLSPEKLQRIKQIAANETPIEIPDEKEEIQLGETPTSNTQRIKMNVNRTIYRNGEPQLQENAVPLEEKVPEVVVPAVVDSDPIETTPQKPEAIGSVSPELAELAKQKRALQVKERELLDKEKALQSQTASGSTIRVEDLKSNALSTLLKHGVTYEQLTNEILKNQGQTPQLDLQSFKEDLLKEIDQKLVGKDTQQEESVYSYMKQNVDKMSFSSNDYKLIRETKSQDKVMDLVKRTWQDQGEILDEAEAMDLIETELRDDARRYARLIGELEETSSPAEKQQKTPQGGTKTLTNKDSARPLMNKRQRAIAAMLGQK